MAHIPSTGRSGAPCKLIVALHGWATDTTFTGDLFPKYSYLDNFANYPQTQVSTVRLNLSGCWDWRGHNGGDIAQKSVPQMRAILSMVAALGGVLPASAALRFRVGVHTPGHAAPPTRPLQRPWAGP
jgi:poly(3-hydroxybutyrate) depolymerase